MTEVDPDADTIPNLDLEEYFQWANRTRKELHEDLGKEEAENLIKEMQVTIDWQDRFSKAYADAIAKQQLGEVKGSLDEDKQDA